MRGASWRPPNPRRSTVQSLRAIESHSDQGTGTARRTGGAERDRSVKNETLLVTVRLFGPRSGLVLFVADLFHPVDGLAVEPFQNGDMRHGRGCRGAMPMLFTRRARDHVTRPNFLDRASPALHQTASRCHDQGLAQRMSVPCGPGAGLERDTDAERARRIGCLE